MCLNIKVICTNTNPNVTQKSYNTNPNTNTNNNNDPNTKYTTNKHNRKVICTNTNPNVWSRKEKPACLSAKFHDLSELSVCPKP